MEMETMEMETMIRTFDCPVSLRALKDAMRQGRACFVYIPSGLLAGPYSEEEIEKSYRSRPCVILRVERVREY